MDPSDKQNEATAIMHVIANESSERLNFWPRFNRLSIGIERCL